ncbi:peptidoglycan-binding domain-containing protein [Clostridium fallax]|uniref:Putative peptidoglycan binding domain-containing protein n=1 Tax=Clostridium fallax TaxID=1533 RepID=A0A1M4T7F2_9CLOT|nr:peptidoglycan-binding domain-containing protein [Clostridium fallax]SHE40345.1 Putative peptidoglycan binding domain-containing protein [Clostridium fallax]SQB22632.1 spore cortex-lytic enzyme SleC [Clostridium fallax]
MASKGRIKIQCFNGENTYIPVDKAKVTITPTGEVASINGSTKEVSTDSSGQTIEIEVDAPPIQYSEEPNNNIPYSFVDIKVERDGFNTLFIQSAQIFPDRLAIQNCDLQQNRYSRQPEVIEVLPNTLLGSYPAKIPEDPEKILPPPPSGTVVLPNPVIPEFIIVHQGSPNDPSAPNYKVTFKDYIKNVASCEIYPTWSRSTIAANILCIISFTLNRVYTEWYTGKGKNFTITSSTAYDHAFNYGRNIFDTIDVVVEEIFSTYIKRIGRKQPLLAQYCDGKNVQCPGWMTQWGSKYLGDEGKTPIQILRNFYGSDIELTTAQKVSGVPKSYPGYTLGLGSKGEPVKTIQNYLNVIARSYPLIPKVIEDGIYGSKTRESVKVFQSVFGLPQIGVVDYATWYKISDVYVGVTKIAELRGTLEGIERIFYPPMTYEMSQSKNIPSVTYFDDLF